MVYKNIYISDRITHLRFSDGFDLSWLGMFERHLCVYVRAGAVLICV